MFFEEHKTELMVGGAVALFLWMRKKKADQASTATPIPDPASTSKLVQTVPANAAEKIKFPTDESGSSLAPGMRQICTQTMPQSCYPKKDDPQFIIPEIPDKTSLTPTDCYMPPCPPGQMCVQMCQSPQYVSEAGPSSIPMAIDYPANMTTQKRMARIY